MEVNSHGEMETSNSHDILYRFQWAPVMGAYKLSVSIHVGEEIEEREQIVTRGGERR
jgi:hypothetical protein